MISEGSCDTDWRLE